MWKSSRGIGCLSVLLFAHIGEVGAKDGAVVSHIFSLDGRRFQIELPTEATIRHSPANDKLAFDLVNITFRRVERSPPMISLHKPLAHDEETGLDRTASMAGGTLAYKISASHESGSGEPEAFLKGRMPLAGQPYLVSCWIQGYNVTINYATWFLKVLHTIRSADTQSE